MKTDTSEKGLESLIMRHMTGTDGLASGMAGVVAETAPVKSGNGWFAGIPASGIEAENEAVCGVGDHRRWDTSRSPHCIQGVVLR